MDEVYKFFDYISQKFGESTETLIQEYAKSQIASDLTVIVIFIVMTALCVIGFKKVKRMAEDENCSYIDDYIAEGIGYACIILSAASLILFIIIAPELIGYIVSPTGTVLRDVLSKF